MKKLLLSSIAFILSIALFAQSVKNNSIELPSDIAKGAIYKSHFTDMDNMELTVIYEKPKFKEKKGESPFYKMVIDLNSYKQKSFEGLAKSPAIKNSGSNSSKEPDNPSPSLYDTKFLRASKNIATGQVKLELGNFYKNYYSYVGSSYGGYSVVSGYNTKFKVIEEVKPKSSSGDRLSYIHSRTQVETNLNIGGLGSWGKPLSIGIGNASVIVQVSEKPKYQKFKTLVYDASTLELKTETPLEFDCSYIPISVTDLPNGGFGLVMRPVSPETESKTKGKHKGCDDLNYRYLSLTPEGDIIESIPFKLPFPKFGISYSFSILPGESNGEVLIAGFGNPTGWGAAFLENYEPKENNEELSTFDEFYYVKIKGGEVVANKSFPSEEFAEKDVSPVKKFKQLKYTGACKILGSFTYKEYEFVYGEFGNRKQIFQFDSNGNLVKSYSYWLNPEKEYTGHVNYLSVAKNGNLYWFFENEKDGERYLELAKIDFENGTLSDITPIYNPELSLNNHSELISGEDGTIHYINFPFGKVDIKEVKL